MPKPRFIHHWKWLHFLCNKICNSMVDFTSSKWIRRNALLLSMAWERVNCHCSTSVVLSWVEHLRATLMSACTYKIGRLSCKWANRFVVFPPFADIFPQVWHEGKETVSSCIFSFHYHPLLNWKNPTQYFYFLAS